MIILQWRGMAKYMLVCISLSLSKTHSLSPGPTAPLHWIKECIELLLPNPSPQRGKILMGLNFYGYDFGSSGLEGNNILH